MTTDITEEEKKAMLKEQEMQKRAKEADDKNITDRVEKDIFITYNMDLKIWRNAQRHHFPYNISLEFIVGVPFFLPLIYMVVDLAVFSKNFLFLKTII